MFREEAVNRRKWLSDQRFMDLVGRDQPDSRSQLDRDGDSPGIRARRMARAGGGGRPIHPAGFPDCDRAGLGLCRVQRGAGAAMGRSTASSRSSSPSWSTPLSAWPRPRWARCGRWCWRSGVLTLYIVGVNELILLAAGRRHRPARPSPRMARTRRPGTVRSAAARSNAGGAHGGEHVQLGPLVPAIPQDRRGALRQRIRAAGLHAGRFCGPPRLAHPAAVAGRRGRSAR